MKFSIGMGSTLSIKDVAPHAQAAEAAGFSHLTLVDTPTMSRDVHVMMMLAAQATERIQIGQGVVDPRSIHPSIIANLSASINEMAPGRVFVGLGTRRPVMKESHTILDGPASACPYTSPPTVPAVSNWPERSPTE